MPFVACKSRGLARPALAAAPAASKVRARGMGWKSGRIRPFEGDAFLISAIMAGPVAAAVRSPAMKPRGVCAAALRSNCA